MKKFFYSIAASLLAIGAVNAQSGVSLWDAENGEKAATFDNWVDVIKDGEVVNVKPFGWFMTAPYGASWMKFEPTTDRFGKEDSACKATVDEITQTWLTWHDQLKTNTDASSVDYNPVYIERGTAFYFTFWAKADEDGLPMHIGPEQLYDPKNNDGDTGSWGKIPSVTLTTKWTKYGFLISERDAFMDMSVFNIHFRSNGVRYIDDIELKTGTELPDDVGTVIDDGASISESATEENPITITSSTDGIGFTSQEGEVAVYDTTGRLAVQKTVSEGDNFINIETKGLFILKFTQEGKSTVLKTIVK